MVGSGNWSDWGVVGSSNWCVVSGGNWCVVSSDWGVVGSGNWSNDLGDWGNWSNDLSDGGFLADDSVESVDWIGSVVNNASGSISFDQGVLSIDDISVAAL
jgi:hypothetical protein